MVEPITIKEPGFPEDPYQQLHLHFQMSPEVFLKAVAFAPDRHRLLSLRHTRSCEGLVEMLLVDWDTLSGRPLRIYNETLPSGACSSFGLVQFSPAGTHVAFTSTDKRIHVIDLSRGLLPGVRTFGRPGDRATRRFGLRSDHYDVTTLVFSPDGHTLCWATRGGEVEICSL